MEANKHYIWRVNPEMAISQFIKSNVALSVSNKYGRIIYANQLFCNITGYNENELLGTVNSLYSLALNKDCYYKNLWKTIESGSVWNGVLKNKTREGSIFSLETIIIPLKDKDGKVDSFVSMYINITEQVLKCS